MAGIRYIRRDRVIRLGRVEADQGTLVEFVDGERVVRHVVPPVMVDALTAQSTAADVALTLWSVPEIRGGLIRWQQAHATAMEGPLPHGEQGIGRLCLRVDDNRLTALPLEQSLLRVLAEIGWSASLIPRLVPVPPRVAQVPFTLPLRLLQLDQRDDFDLPYTINMVTRTGRRDPAVMQVKIDRARRFSRWRMPPRWKTVDILHLDQLPILPERRLLSMSAPGEVGTLGWLVRCVDLWRTRLVVVRGHGASEMALLRSLAHRLTAQGGPAVWLVDSDSAEANLRLTHLYEQLIHDAPIDLAAAMAVDGSLSPSSSNDTLIVGCGREELVRVSAPGNDVATLTLELHDPDPSTRADVARRLWSYVAGSERDIGDAAMTYAKTVWGLERISARLLSWNFDSEHAGLIPLGRAMGRLRKNTRITPAPPIELRPTPDRSGPRYVNSTLWRLDLATGRKQPIPQRAARLRQGEPIVLGVQLGPHTGYTPVLDATALIEEPFKWEEGREGVWLSVGLTSLDFVATGALVQEVWLPRYGASDVVEFLVEPIRQGISQLRFCIYYGADLLQSHRLAAMVENATGTGGTTSELAAALDVAAEHVGDAGWCARMEYAAAVDLASPPATASRDVALSIFANDLGGRRVFTARGTEGYEVLLAGDTSDMASDIRAKLDSVSRDQFNLYAFRERNGTPLHSGTPQQRDAALHDLAHVGWTLFAAIFKGADREAMAADLAGERRIIHIAHALLESVIPWAAVYDRPYDIDRQRDDAGRPVLRAVCPAGLPDAAGTFPATVCGTAPNCPLSPQGRTAAAATGKGVAEDTIVCARSFWGFRHIVELPPYQEDGPTATSTMTTIVAAGTTAPPPRRRVTSAGNPVQLLLGYNAILSSAQSHRAALQGILKGRKLHAIWQEENSGDRFLTALRRADADLVYLFCHARGGLADLTIKPPALELQESASSGPSLIRAAALASGLRFTHHPLVILNGCNTALFSPDALSPFIRTLVRDCDAAGALGTEIPVFEVFAGEVACQFLSRFLDGQKAGEALLGIRRELLARGNPLGLIYTLYAVAELEIAQ